MGGDSGTLSILDILVIYMTVKLMFLSFKRFQGRFNLTEDWHKACIFKQMVCYGELQSLGLFPKYEVRVGQ